MWRVALVVVALASASVPARARERSARLVYAGTACRAEELAAQMTALLGRDPFTRDGELIVGVTVEDGGVEAGAPLVRATLEIRGPRVLARRLEAASCAELADALAFVIVMALAAPEPARTSGAAAERAGARQERDAEEPLGARARVPIRLAALGGAAASARLRPQAFVGIRVRRGRLSAALELAADLPDSFASEPGRVTIARASATLAPCVHRGTLAVCATLAGGAFRGRGEGFTDSRTAMMPLAEVGARIAWERALTGRVGLHARGEAGGVLTRNRFFIDDRLVWEAGRFEARLGLGVAVRFP